MPPSVLVIDTNILISFALFPDGILGKSVSKALACHEFAFSRATFSELEEVLMRSKFDRYVSPESRQEFLDVLTASAKWIEDSELPRVTDCRDSNDNKFLDVAIACNAEYIVSGDMDLLILNPYRGIRIVTIAELMNTLREV